MSQNNDNLITNQADNIQIKLAKIRKKIDRVRRAAKSGQNNNSQSDWAGIQADWESINMDLQLVDLFMARFDHNPQNDRLTAAKTAHKSVKEVLSNCQPN